MTPEQKKLIFDYCGWCETCDIQPTCTNYDRLECRHTLDGNDMVAAMNKIVENCEWGDFERKVVLSYMQTEYNQQLIPWLMQPDRFFELMSKWLEVKDAKAK
ncbi:MAG: hypothetical protein PHW03_05335 [Eubacteriales bacterium]|nr:hypothetical protein [Eubacteriales bacterium]